MSDSAPITSICKKCHGPVSVPPHRAEEIPKEPTHIGVPGNPIECP